MSLLRCLAMLLIILALPAAAVQPDEVLADPTLEARARQISTELRCPVCQGETIDESDAPISRDLRLYVRERLVAGDSDAAVLDAVVARYGEFVLFRPPRSGVNLLLWWAGPIAALAGLGLAFAYVRGRRSAEAPVPLSAEEAARLDRILRDEA